MQAGLTALAAALVGISPPATGDSTNPLAELVDAAAQRLATAEPVAAYKWSAQRAIEDPEREQQELATLGDEARAQGIDPDYVARVFRDQIDAIDAIEYTRFADWKLNPATVPSAPPDLSVPRSAIDSLNTKIMSQIALNRSLLEAPDCRPQLAAAVRETIRRRLLDSLYQRALTSATGSFCSSAAPA
ncbi:chorismate mutase [Mycobacterium sp. 1423905.2]|uniref:chorismate mutase n=1 Tax=Mycobacterium sp. 1423905.2 TaxID=1856859 RepID=UPI0012EAA29C